MPRQGRRLARASGIFGAAGVITFWAAVATLQVVRPDLSTLDDFVSDYANGPWAWLFAVGVLSHGAGNLAIAAGLAAELGRQRAAAVGVVGFGLAAGGLLTAGLFRTDPPGAPGSTAGAVHRIATSFSFGAELVALLALALAFHARPAWRGYVRPSVLLTLVAAAATTWLVAALRVGAAAGLAERAALAAFTVWEFTTAVRMAGQDTRRPVASAKAGALAMPSTRDVTPAA